MLGKWKRILGEEYFYMLISMINFVYIWKVMGCFEVVVELMQECVCFCQKVLGLDYFDIVESLLVLEEWQDLRGEGGGNGNIYGNFEVNIVMKSGENVGGSSSYYEDVDNGMDDDVGYEGNENGNNKVGQSLEFQ